MSSTTPTTLAIDGGTPVRETLLSFSPPVMGDEEIASVIETLRSGWLTSGPRARELEQRFAAYVGAPHAIATSSCTTALHLALIPLVAGVAYEVIRLAGRFRNLSITRFLLAPGLWSQQLTTREPDAEHVEVALAALKAVLHEEGAGVKEDLPQAAAAAVA